MGHATGMEGTRRTELNGCGGEDVWVQCGWSSLGRVHSPKGVLGARCTPRAEDHKRRPEMCESGHGTRPGLGGERCQLFQPLCGSLGWRVTPRSIRDLLSRELARLYSISKDRTNACTSF